MGRRTTRGRKRRKKRRRTERVAKQTREKDSKPTRARATPPTKVHLGSLPWRKLGCPAASCLSGTCLCKSHCYADLGTDCAAAACQLPPTAGSACSGLLRLLSPFHQPAPCRCQLTMVPCMPCRLPDGGGRPCRQRAGRRRVTAAALHCCPCSAGPYRLFCTG